MLEDVKNLLKALGITIEGEDQLLAYIVNSVTEQVKNETNQTAVPDGLHYVAVEMAVGRYLSFKKDSGQLTTETIDLTAAIKQIQEGDTNITFAIGEGSLTPEQRLTNLINYLISGRSREFIRYRRLLW